MNYLKRSIMAVAITSVCLLSASADAFTKNLSARFPTTHPNIDYTITFKANFPPYPFSLEENEETEGTCSFCYNDHSFHNECWDYTYSWDGKKTFYVDQVGAIFHIKDNVIYNGLRFEVIK